MARRKRPDYVRPSRRERVREQEPAPEQPPASYFPPGTWRKVLIGGGVGAAGLAALVVASLLNGAGDRAQEKALTRGSCTLDARTDAVPPSGGALDAPAAAPGSYAGTTSGSGVPSDAALVRAMAQGRVVLWHRPGVATSAAASLRAAHSKDLLTVERSDLPVPLAVTAWHQRLLCQEVEPAVLERFVDTRKGSGPE